ncbi:hypothetical protein Acsp03_68130 [Actinomadura sp. NBRC 104412]|uniref:S8 family peptidase n=1 Tax=Actinomadura sp. NBRC 104412 TaxID=3032203 RepID=UPI0024A1AA6A|nr:S8 family serine peptidase [Actinomadura sp. NBRC 104412]GLZ09347.1 hypothetical protein Acsp03_68130 [Actinomadura sp. NBRC 104412]
MSRAGRRGRALAVRFGAAVLALTLVPGGGVGLLWEPGRAAAEPVDQIRARQWHLDAMRIPRAWRTSKGAGVTVAVLDTGVDRRHPDLVGRVTTGPDLTGGTRSPGDKYWGLHGTSMASIIAGHGNGPGRRRGVIGVAPSSRILSIRVTWENDDPQRRNGGEGNRNRDAVAQGIRYAADHGADIINMSLGGGRLFYDGNSTEESAVRYALDKGVVLIASAGNDGAGPNRNNFPAAYRGVIAVGALDRRLQLWKDSNRRPYVAVCAPGVEIVSADSSSGYVIGTGTSPSSAIVAGVAALIRSRYPRLSPDEVREALVKGTVPDRPTGSSTCTGPLDAVRALSAAARIDRTEGGAEDGPRSPSPAPVTYEENAGGRDGLLLAAILGGGGLIVGVVVLLSLRRRPPPDAEPDDFDEVEDYGLGAHRMPRPQPAFAAHDAGRDTYTAPAGAPVWQSNEVYAPPPSLQPERPERRSGDVPAGKGASVPPIPSELRPSLPYGGTRPARGTGEFPGMGDDAWDRFRRDALEEASLPSMPQREQRPGEPSTLHNGYTPPVRHVDDLPGNAFPAAPPPVDHDPPDRSVPPDDDWRGLPKRNRRRAGGDESLPPWW